MQVSKEALCNPLKELSFDHPTVTQVSKETLSNPLKKVGLPLRC